MLAASMFLAVAPLCAAYETDQFTNRAEPIADSTAALNQKVNRAIKDTAKDVRSSNRLRITFGIYHRLGGISLVDKLERWALKSDKVERLDTPKHHSIYSGLPFWSTRIASLFGVGATVRINHVLVGTDKIGHFFSQGWKFYRRVYRTHDVAQSAAHSALTERGFFGQISTGSYSNADLVANYEGYRFYRGLFEPDRLTGKPAILAWQGDRWVMQRPFDWADYVNDYWDEALNINHYDKLLKPRMKKRILGYCDEYEANPQLFIVHNEAALKKRYRMLHLRDTSELRLNRLCPKPNKRHVAASTTATSVAGSH